MNRQYNPQDTSQQHASTGRVKQTARKLNFHTEEAEGIQSSHPQQTAPLCWRNVNNDTECSDNILSTAPYFSIPSGCQTVSSFQSPFDDIEEPSAKKCFRSIVKSESLLDCEPSDDITDLDCRPSAGTTNVVSFIDSPSREIPRKSQRLLDVMVDLDLTKCFQDTFADNPDTNTSNRIKFKQKVSKSETVANVFSGQDIKFRSPSNYDQCSVKTHVSRNGDITEVSTSCFSPSDLAPISHMLRTCEVFHPLDMAPKEPYPSPALSPVRSLMDGGDAVDVRGLATRLAHMKSESSMKNALLQYMHTHIPSMQGKMDQIIESTVQQIADVSLRENNVSGTDVSEITSTQDWLKIQNGDRELNCLNVSNYGNNNSRTTSTFVNAGDSSPDSMNDSSGASTEASADGIVELDTEDMKHHRIECDDDHTITSGRCIGEICCSRGCLIHSEYISPEEYRFASYNSKKGKRKIQEVDGNPDPSPGCPKRKGKKTVVFAAPEVTGFNNGPSN